MYLLLLIAIIVLKTLLCKGLAIGYVGFRLGNALERGTGLQLYAPISILLILMFFMLFTHTAANDKGLFFL